MVRFTVESEHPSPALAKWQMTQVIDSKAGRNYWQGQVSRRHVHPTHFRFSSHFSAEAISPLWFGLIV